ncbi:hypothetical protein PIB30_039281 [Stylosanthes scabra]|uniref:Ribonuclease H1 N-terminal domain-containing protein n=1 Tax=Stylosanthes scabra TaxID=79078 RepID=A0ABU6XBX0_9FABA|nr:hypothetical protein [Stylosanthes scabra]
MEGKYSHYAVRVDKVPGIYTSWEEAEEQVSGYSFAKFKGFKNLAEAVAYMQQGKDRKQKGPLRNVETLTPQMRKLGVGLSQAGLTQIGASGSGPSMPVGSAESEYVPETRLGGFLIVEEMELYLVRACMKLSMGCPILDGRAFYDQYGAKMFCFTGAFRCEEKGVYFEVEGCVCADQIRAREDAAYKLLDRLLTHTGHTILDFNYRRLCASQQQVEELRVVQDNEAEDRQTQIWAETPRYTWEMNSNIQEAYFDHFNQDLSSLKSIHQSRTHLEDSREY